MRDSLVEVGDWGDPGILPEAFEAIEFACLALEDVDQGIAVVDGHPLAVLQSDDTLPMLSVVLLNVIDQPGGDAQDVGGGGAFAYDEVLEGGFLDVAHVDELEITGLAVLKTFDDYFY